MSSPTSEGPTRNWTENSLKGKTKERNAHFVRAALETLDELACFTMAGRARPMDSKKKPVKEALLTKLPKYGVVCNEEDERSLDEIMEGIDQWGMDVHLVSRLSGGHPLVVLMYTVFKRRGLFKFLGISELTFLNCILAFESKYNKKPNYHNAIHASDIVHSVHVMLNGLTLRKQCAFDELEIVAALFAAAVHDVGHPGQKNAYFQAKGDELFSRYGDEACLECQSLDIAFETLRNPNFDVFANLDRRQRALIRKMMIDMVIATDMTRHRLLLQELDELLNLKRASNNGFNLPTGYTPKIRVLQCVLHCSDLSNPTKPLRLYTNWASSIMEEWFAQGDKEKAEGLKVSNLCDRETTVPEKCQADFIGAVVVPQYEKWAEFVRPDADDVIKQLKSNLQWYQAEHARKEANKNAQTSSNKNGQANGSTEN